MELDCFIPEWDLAFEYQGEHHYSQVSQITIVIVIIVIIVIATEIIVITTIE